MQPREALYNFRASLFTTCARAYIYTPSDSGSCSLANWARAGGSPSTARRPDAAWRVQRARGRVEPLITGAALGGLRPPLPPLSAHARVIEFRKLLPCVGILARAAAPERDEPYALVKGGPSSSSSYSGPRKHTALIMFEKQGPRPRGFLCRVRLPISARGGLASGCMRACMFFRIFLIGGKRFCGY